MHVLGASKTSASHDSEHKSIGASTKAYSKSQTFDFASSSHTHRFSGSGSVTVDPITGSGSVSVSGTTGSPS